MGETGVKEETAGEEKLHDVSGGGLYPGEEIGKKPLGNPSGSQDIPEGCGVTFDGAFYYWHGGLITNDQATAIITYYKDLGQEPSSPWDAADYCRKKASVFSE